MNIQDMIRAANIAITRSNKTVDVDWVMDWGMVNIPEFREFIIEATKHNREALRWTDAVAWIGDYLRKLMAGG